jgi:hypothetical protein
MTLPPPKVCRRIRKLHAQMGSSDKDAEVARHKLIETLAEYGLSWNDLSKILAAIESGDGDYSGGGHGNAAADLGTSSDAPDAPDVLAVLLRLLEEHVFVTANERIAIALWILHTWIFDRFPITPRLALASPVRGCGKTTVLSLIELLIYEGERIDSITAAAIYHQLERRPRTVLLVDEADNLDLFRNPVLRSVFNSGHRRGGGVSRFVGSWSRRYPTFAPLAVAAIGMLPLPLMHRSIVINMQRSSAQLRRLDETDPAFARTRQTIRDWAGSVQLALEPEMPPALRNRAADNWRPLLGVADAFGYGTEARVAAVALSADWLDEDPGVVLLNDIRTDFGGLRADRIASSALVEALVRLDDGPWHEWRGVNDDRPPRKLTQSELSRLLRPFGIRPKTIWPARRGPGDRSSRGYLRSDFEPAWHSYCPSADTPTQPSKIIPLSRR